LKKIIFSRQDFPTKKTAYCIMPFFLQSVITSYIVALCAVAQGHLDVATSYSKVPTAFASSKKTDSVSTAHASHVRLDKNQDCTHDSSRIHPKESWQARRASNVANGTTANATAGRDVNAWVETVPRRYGQHEQHTEQDSYEDKDFWRLNLSLHVLTFYSYSR
jgi:hypothetical protein